MFLKYEYIQSSLSRLFNSSLLATFPCIQTIRALRARVYRPPARQLLRCELRLELFSGIPARPCHKSEVAAGSG